MLSRVIYKGQTYEWDSKKEKENIKKHNLSFMEAIKLFDTNYISRRDNKHSDKEERVQYMGFIGVVIVLVIATDKKDAIRIISARRANKREVKGFNNDYKRIYG